MTSGSHAPRSNAYIKTKVIVTLCLILLLITACTENKATINIAVASNFEPTLKQIIQLYPDKQIKINIIAGSSGVLTNQILNKAPYDLFLSADTDKPELIFRKLKLKTTPVVYAIGKLALWIPNSSGTNCLQQLPKLKTLVLANPKTAPYGKAAKGILETNNTQVKKTIQTANASQANIYTKDGLTQAGFVPYSMVKNEKKGCLQVFENVKLEQGMVLLNDKAQSFFEFMQSAEAINEIKRFGYW